MIATSLGGTVTGKGGERIICVSPETLIATNQGELPIGDIVYHQLDCLVATFNHYTKQVEYLPILQCQISRLQPYNPLVEVEFADRKLRCTYDHEIYLDNNEYTYAGICDESHSAYALIDSYELTKIPIVAESKAIDYPFNWVFNLTTSNQNYFANGILVHNCDDPHNPKQAESDVQRESALRSFDQTLSTRLNNKETGAIVVIMQRLHEKDLTGHILSDIGNYTHVCLPVEAEKTETILFPRSRKTLIRDVGTLLHPERENAEQVALAKRQLGSQGFAGQYMQRPSPEGGGLFKEHWWKYYTALPPKFDEVIQSWDCAFKATATSDYVVGQVWGRIGADFYLIDQLRARADINDTLRMIETLCNHYPFSYAKLVEDKANGSAVIDLLKRKIPGMIAVNPEGGKEARANAVAPYVESGNVFLPNVPWVKDLIHECSSFPAGANDDIVDCLSMAINYFQKADTNWIRALL